MHKTADLIETQARHKVGMCYIIANTPQFLRKKLLRPNTKMASPSVPAAHLSSLV